MLDAEQSPNTLGSTDIDVENQWFPFGKLYLHQNGGLVDFLASILVYP